VSKQASRPVEQNKVFISSVMRTAVEDLLSERMIVYDAVCSYDFLIPWAFERTPASSEDLEESYLRPVEESDLFILIIGAQATEAVIAESIRAKELDKHILVFVKKTEWQSQAVRLLLKQLDKKYATFASLEELRRQAKDAIDQISALSLRSPSIRYFLSLANPYVFESHRSSRDLPRKTRFLYDKPMRKKSFCTKPALKRMFPYRPTESQKFLTWGQMHRKL
jgi:hypothetical protein